MSVFIGISSFICGYLFKKYSQYDEAKSGMLIINGQYFARYYGETSLTQQQRK